MLSNNSEKDLITKEFFDTQRKLEKVNERRRILIAQESENQMVEKELELLDNDAVIYKLIGSVMIKQSLDEAKSTVSKRLEYITAEIDSVNKTFDSLKNTLVEKSNQSFLDSDGNTLEQYEEKYNGNKDNDNPGPHTNCF